MADPLAELSNTGVSIWLDDPRGRLRIAIFEASWQTAGEHVAFALRRQPAR
jgi:hypothetical protein